MILNGLTDLSTWFISLVFSGFQAISLPANLISVLIDIMKFGSWVIGSDLLAIVFGTIFGWLAFKLTAGLIIFIWELIPLT